MRELPYNPDLWLIPDSDYEAYIMEAKEKMSSYGDHVRLTWKILSEGVYKGQTINDNFYIHGKEKKHLKAQNRLGEILLICIGHRDLDQLFRLVDRTATLTLKSFTPEEGEAKNFIVKRVLHIPQRIYAASSSSASSDVSKKADNFGNEIRL